MPHFVIFAPFSSTCHNLHFFPLFVIPGSFCIFFDSLCNFRSAPLCNHKMLSHFVIIFSHFVIIYRNNLGTFLYIFDSLVIFPRKFNHGEDDRRILNFWNVAVEKRQITRELLIFVYRYKYFV